MSIRGWHEDGEACYEMDCAEERHVTDPNDFVAGSQVRELNDGFAPKGERLEVRVHGVVLATVAAGYYYAPDVLSRVAQRWADSLGETTEIMRFRGEGYALEQMVIGTFAPSAEVSRDLPSVGEVETQEDGDDDDG